MFFINLLKINTLLNILHKFTLTYFLHVTKIIAISWINLRFLILN